MCDIVDWAHPVVVDAVWARLVSWEGVWQFWEHRFDSPLRMVLVLKGVSRTFGVSLDGLWCAIGRPYLSHVDLGYAGRVLLCEYASRRLVQSLLDGIEAIADAEAVIAGGFAAWEFERWLQTLHGLDGFPRCVRDTTFHDGLPRNQLWVPEDINLFFTGNTDAVLKVVERAYADFCGLLGRAQVLLEMCIESDAIADVGDDDDDVERQLSRVMVDAEFPYVIIDEAVRSLRMAPTRTTVPCERTWRLHSQSEPLFPITLHVTRTPPLSASAAPTYGEFILDTFDFVHCCVALSVTRQGAWRFDSDAVVLDCIKHRVLRFNTVPFTCVAQVSQTVRRLIKYYMNGFTFRGDVFHSML